MKRHDWWPMAALGLVMLQINGAHAFDGAGAAPAAQAAVARQDAWHRTASGVPYLLPAGWALEAGGAAAVMSAPEGGANIAIVDVQATTAEQALAAAWARYRPDAAPTLRDARDRPLRSGWSLVRTYQYARADQPDRILRAQVLHEGATWIVVILDLPPEVMNRRETQVTRVLSSLRAKTYVPESLAGVPARDLDAEKIASLVRFLDDARTGLNIPGLALGVVQNGEVKYAGGLGVRQRGRDAAVDASTMFLTASVTKPMTSLMLAKLVDMGTLEWDTPAVKALPSFAVGDAPLTERILVRHMVCACTGIPAQDMEWVFSGDEMGAEDVVKVLGRVAPTAGHGELYQYSNLMAAAGGYLGGHAWRGALPLGESYDRAMQDLVFDPLGMAATTFDFDKARRGNFASPHGTAIDGDTVVSSMGMNLMSIPMRPDGGAWSNIDDMVRYLRVELSAGRLPNGQRYIGEDALKERINSQVARGGMDQWYGMGLKTDRRLGILQVMHGGSMAGYQAEVYWLPDSGAGYVLLMNADAGAHLRGVFSDRFLEVLFGVDRNAEASLKALPAQLKQQHAEHRATIRAPLDARTVGRLAPAYIHPTLGTIRVVAEGPATWFDMGGWRSEIAQVAADADAPADADATVLETVSSSVAGMRFVMTEANGARALVLNDGQKTYTFVEAAFVEAAPAPDAHRRGGTR